MNINFEVFRSRRQLVEHSGLKTKAAKYGIGSAITTRSGKTVGVTSKFFLFISDVSEIAESKIKCRVGIREKKIMIVISTFHANVNKFERGMQL